MFIKRFFTLLFVLTSSIAMNAEYCAAKEVDNLGQDTSMVEKPNRGKIAKFYAARRNKNVSRSTLLEILVYLEKKHDDLEQKVDILIASKL